MTKTENEQLLEELYTATVKTLLDKVRSGDATAADLSVARHLLRDNGITCVPTPHNDLGALISEITDEDLELQ